MKSRKNKAYRQDIVDLIREIFGSSPEYLWTKYPDYAVFRHNGNRKWYAVIMDVPREKLGLEGKEKVDILEIKCDPLMSGSLLAESGILPAYHMKKGSWLTVLLDGTVDKNLAFSLVEMSFDLTKSRQKKLSERTQPKEWLIPANPAYYDVEKAFSQSDIILWKQGANIIVGDTIFLYMAAPISAVLYKCEAVEVNIPYKFDSDQVTIRKAMKIKLLHRYDKEQFTFKTLNAFGVFAVRGPRSVPYSLSCELNNAALK